MKSSSTSRSATCNAFQAARSKQQPPDIQLETFPDAIAVNGGPGLLSLVHGDCLPWLLARDWAGDEMLYADPPYVMSARSAQRAYYEYEYTDQDHVDLLAVLCSLPCRVMVSGYRSELYGDLLADWRAISFQTVDRGGNLKTEWAWMN